MPAEKFNLSDHVQAVLNIAQCNEVTVAVAFQYFIANLATMKEHYKGADGLNYHALGQQWNKLLSPEKLAQKAEMASRLAKYDRGGNA